MGVSTVSMRYWAAFLCVFLSSTPSLARTTLSNESLPGELCGDLTDDSEVRIFVSRDDLGSEYGTNVEICQAVKLFAKFVKGAVDDGEGGGSSTLSRITQRNPPTSDFGLRKAMRRPAACDEPDIVSAMVSNTIPDSESVCDITEAYLALFVDDDPNNGAAKTVCYPPPWYCHFTTIGKRRRLMDFQGSMASAASITSSVSSGSSISIEGGSGASPAFIQQPRSHIPGDFIQVSRKAAVTACKGECCVTTVVTGAMYFRLLEFVPKDSCPGFVPSHIPTTTITTVATSTSSGVSSSASSSSSTTVDSTLPPTYFGSLP